MKHLRGVARSGIVFVAAVSGLSCASPLQRLVGAGQYARACAMHRENERDYSRPLDYAGEAAVEGIVRDRDDLQVAMTVVPPEETEAALGAPIAAQTATVVRVRAVVTSLPPQATSVLLGPFAYAHTDDVGTTAALDWRPLARSRDGELFRARICAAVPAEPLPPMPPAYTRRAYQPTPMPRLETVTRGVTLSERVVGDLLNAFTLGIVDSPHERTSLTAEGRRAYRAWSRENAAARRQWDEQEQARERESQALREEARRRNEYAQQAPARCAEAVARAAEPRCTAGAVRVEHAELPVGGSCEWVTAVSTSAEPARNPRVFFHTVYRYDADGAECELGTALMVTGGTDLVSLVRERFGAEPRSVLGLGR